MHFQENGWPSWLTTWNHLGSHYPYYWSENGPQHFHMSISSALEEMPIEQRRIDPVGVVEILSKSYLLGNRTLVRGLRRSPWMGCPSGHGSWKYANIPQHGNTLLPTGDVVARFKEALRREALGYLIGKKRVGILLSGGLDSRVVAGIVRELQLTGEFTGDVIALTWGVEASRDVIYAWEIAKRYDWEWLHFPLGPEVLARNIRVAGEMGAEFSPLHLHALPQIRELDGIDAILAGSYGDSVGRAEFSGRRISQLKPTVPRLLNQFGLIRDKIVRTGRATVLQDAYGYRKYIQRNTVYEYRELEQEMHYMRRKLQTCMSYVAERIPLFQLFTAPEVFALMWSLDPGIRDDRFYTALLPTLPEDIGSLPWARIGRPLGAPKGPTDKAPKLFHKYGVWLRRDLQVMVAQLVMSDTIKDLNLFNEQTLHQLVKLWPRAQTTSTNRIDEMISWLASLAIFVEKYDIQPVDTALASWQDTMNVLPGVARAWAYQTVRDKFRQ